MNNNFDNNTNQYDNPFFNNNLQPPFNNFNKNQLSQSNQQNAIYTKIYLGQLPLEISQNDLKQAFQQHCQINQIKIVKGNAQGQFARYCYAFLNIKGNQTYSNDVIRKIQQKYSNWRINIRADYEKIQNKLRSEFQNSHQNYPNQNPNFIQPLNFNNRQFINYNQGQKGIKTHKILVRQIWLGGIPQGISEQTMRQVMGYFGIIETLEIFAKFAFIKYKLVNDATTAFQKAARIHQQFGKQSGFRIFFSDPQKRTNIVSNHYQFDRQSEYLPILFLGFPPITSSFVDEVYMRSICEKYGPIIDTYMRKNNNPQTRSYILLTYANLKSATKAKYQLSKRRELLGDKRVEVALLLSQQPILKGRNFQSTIEKFQSNTNFEKKNSKNLNTNIINPNYPNLHSHLSNNMYMQYPNYPPFNPNRIAPVPIGMPNQMNSINTIDPINQMNQMNMNPSMMPYFSMMMDDSMRNIPYYHASQGALPLQNYNQSDDVVKIIESVLNSTKKQQNQRQQERYKDLKQSRQSPCWSGFLIRNKNFRVGVDGYTKTQNFQFDQIMINITYSIKLQELKFKNKKNAMILQPSNDTQKRTFDEYINCFKNKESAGVSLNFKEILFILPKCQVSDQILDIKETQLLVVIEDITLYHELNHKFQKLEENN